MKRILLITLVVLLTFIGCTKAEPEREISAAASTAEEALDSKAYHETSKTDATGNTEESSKEQNSSLIDKATAHTSTAKAVLTTKEQPSTFIEATASTQAATVTTAHYTSAVTTSAAKTTAGTTAVKTTSPVPTTTESAGIDTFEPVVTAKPTEKETTVSQITVTVICSCKNAVDYGIREENELIPENGIMFSTSVTLKDGSTAMDAIKAACAQSSVEIKETRGYIRSIGGLAEKDCGGASGWLYSVNGSFPNTSSDKYVLHANDKIELHYTVKNGDVVRM